MEITKFQAQIIKFKLRIHAIEDMCRLFSKRPKTIFVLRKNQISSFYYLCGIAYFYVAGKWFQAVLKINYTYKWKRGGPLGPQALRPKRCYCVIVSYLFYLQKFVKYRLKFDDLGLKFTNIHCPNFDRYRIGIKFLQFTDTFKTRIV